MNKKWLMVFMLGGLFTTGAFAQEKVVSGNKVVSNKTLTTEKKPSEEKLTTKLDADNDGKISREEADKSPRSKIKANFATIDTNKDTYIDKEELKAYRLQKKAEKQPAKQE